MGGTRDLFLGTSYTNTLARPYSHRTERYTYSTEEIHKNSLDMFCLRKTTYTIFSRVFSTHTHTHTHLTVNFPLKGQEEGSYSVKNVNKMLKGVEWSEE